MSGGQGFPVEEVDGLLDIIEDLLPIGWDNVTECHCTYYPGLGHTKEFLKHKFSLLYNHKKPTGDPTCSASMHRAKRAWERALRRRWMCPMANISILMIFMFKRLLH